MRFHGAQVLVLLVIGICWTPSAGASEWRHQVLVEDSVRFLEKYLNERAAEGFRVTAVVNDVAHRAILMSRRSAGEAGRYTYRVLEGVSDSTFRQAGDEGFAWRGGAVVRGHLMPYFVLERDAKNSARVELEVFSAKWAPATRRDLGKLLSAGFTISGAFALREGPGEELLLERRASASPRELEFLEDTNPGNMSRNLAASAKEGFTLDAFWTRPVGERPGPPDLASAALSRARGDTSPRPTLRLTREDDPGHRIEERLIAWAPFKWSNATQTLYVYAAGGHDVYDSCESPSPGLLGAERDVQSALEQSLRQCETNEIVATWIVPSEDGKPVFHFVTRRQ